MVTVGEGKGGMTSESSTETCTLQYVKWIASGNLLYDAGTPVVMYGCESWTIKKAEC